MTPEPAGTPVGRAPMADAPERRVDERAYERAYEREYERLLEAERAARAEAERARAEAESAAQAKSAFLATMSHELRTPLNAIIGYAELLDLGVFGAVTPAQHAHLERLRASARHLLGLVGDVLDLAKIDAGRLEVRRELAVTGMAVAAAVALVQPQATAKGVLLVDAHAGEPGVRYMGDEHRVQQVVVNLLSNAVKFTPGGGQVTIICGVAEASDQGDSAATPARDELTLDSPVRGPGPWAFIRVDDTGPGISPEFMGRLFEPFVQEEGSYTREHGGTGLGLSISRRLARLMGGDLTGGARRGPEIAGPGASTASGSDGVSGASFTLWLPVDVPAARVTPPGGPPHEAPARASVAAVGGRPVEPAPPLTADAYAVVHALGMRVAQAAEPVAERYVARLRMLGEAGDLPGGGRLPAAQLRNHATPFIALIASQLMTLGELRGRAPELLGDTGRVQRLMAELHGAQRLGLGWTEAQLDRDFVLIRDEIERTLRASVDEGVTAGAAPGGAGQTSADPAPHDPAPRDAALAYALQVTRHILERAARTSVAAYGAARTAAQ